MHNDALLSLAHGIYTQKGVYALIIGSGISKEANVPSISDILNDLITKTHCIPAGEYPANPYIWYQERFNETPVLSKLLSTLAKSPADRELILRNYFKKPDDCKDGSMEPTSAHRAIARIVKKGFIKALITTSIDTLLEQAMADEGVSPEIVRSGAQADSVIPLPHSSCVIVKVNGDYTVFSDSSAGDTDGAGRINAFTERIIDEFGTVVCGWSACWESGLREALLNVRSRRFATYWLYKGNISKEAEHVIAFRRAEAIEITGAGDFFTALEDSINTLIRIGETRHPLAVETACDRIKKWLPNPAEIIRLNDMVVNEARLVSKFKESHEWLENPGPEDIEDRIKAMESIAKPIVSLLAIGGYWGEARHDNIWRRAIESLMYGSEKVFRTNLHLYIPLQALYAVLIPALANRRYELAYLILNGCYHTVSHKLYTVADTLHASGIMEYSMLNYALDQHNEVPVSERLFNILQAPCIRVIHTEDIYETIFDKVEYLIHLNFKHRNPEQSPPLGRFSIEKRGLYISRETLLEAEAPELIKAGFFGGDINIYQSLMR